jgi:membrane associated rhomboid family serine protease
MAYGFTPSGSMPRAIRILLGINVALFLIDLIIPGKYIFTYLALDPIRTIHQLEVWRLITYLFVHSSNPFHILINMLLLWMFGSSLVDTMGERKFWWFYLATGVFSGLCSLVFYSVTKNPTTVIGASGALFGLMFAFAKYFPTQQFLILFLFPVQARYAVFIFGAVELVSITANDNIAHVAHLGGAVFAWLYFMFEERGVAVLSTWQNRKANRAQKVAKKTAQELGQVMVDIDPILKKISLTGMNSLTKEEKEKLEKASELKRKQKSKLISLDEYRNRQ